MYTPEEIKTMAEQEFPWRYPPDEPISLKCQSRREGFELGFLKCQALQKSKEFERLTSDFLDWADIEGWRRSKNYNVWIKHNIQSAPERTTMELFEDYLKRNMIVEKALSEPPISPAKADKIPIYEIWHKGKKIGMFWYKGFAEKVNKFLNDEKTPQ